MRPGPPWKGLRAREIALAVGIGAIGAGGAALLIDMEDHDPAPVAATADRMSYEVEDFDKVASVGPQIVTVTLGETYSVRAQGPARVLAQLEVSVDDDTLTIQPMERFRGSFDWSRFSAARFFVTLPRIEGASLAGSGTMRIERVEGDDFSAQVAGQGEMNIADMQVDDAEFSISGSGELVAAGRARDVDVTIAGSGEMRAGGLSSEEASVSVAGSGEAMLAVSDEARISIMGSGDVDIVGGAQCSVSRMGSGEVRCNGQEID